LDVAADPEMSSNTDIVATDQAKSLAEVAPGAAARERRARALLNATISTFDNALSTPCLVNNISNSGARITISESIPLGAEFKISIPQRGITCVARQVWRQGDQLGVAFQPDPGVAAAQSGADKDARIRALEAENAHLKAEIGILRNLLYRRDEG